MDYPSDPSVRLHPTIGKFTDGESATDIPASVDKAAVYNQLFDELLHVIKQADLTPDENDLTQVWQSIISLFVFAGSMQDRYFILKVKDAGVVFDVVVQMGFAIVPANSTKTVTLPVALTAQHLCLLTSQNDGSPGSIHGTRGDGVSTTQIQLSTNAPGSDGVYWLSIGY